MESIHAEPEATGFAATPMLACGAQTSTASPPERVRRGAAGTAVPAGHGDRPRGEVPEGFAELFEEHRDGGLAFAYSLVRHHADADDLVSRSFLKILAAIRAGKGPVGPFRPYLYRVIRTSAVGHWNTTNKVRQVGDLPDRGAGYTFVEESGEHELAARAFTALPSRWRHGLELLDVQGLKPAEAAPILGMRPNAVSALAGRARRGLREAYLTLSLDEPAQDDCVPLGKLLAREVLQTASHRERTKLYEHLDKCPHCTRALARLRETYAAMGAL
ncbi:sigma-70 family RNA polymerase sigma factor [Arthrobacter sp. ISL-48]|uniref:RNA polymerase sigma factor n=1 Tax=Arthrobacter sp. ISL-48 TaxID=2819110 RepID=UPI001BE7BA92|nr:sigma-70 family RNA polymerase sigma factor [Arthrobacter sp. ISL-48]MBT2533757.1 sigma-70 family RNA polymerase sigma factor [Arthrobacter sp. ISL-48]